MTHYDDKKKAPAANSFKEQMLSELKRSNQLRQQQYQEDQKSVAFADKIAIELERYDSDIQTAPLKSNPKQSDELTQQERLDVPHPTPSQLASARATMPVTADEQNPKTVQPAEGRKAEVRRKRRRQRQKTNTIARRIAAIVILAMLSLLLATVFFGYRYVASALQPLDSHSTSYITVNIPEGSGNKYIGRILEKAGVIKSAIVFNYYSKFKNYSNFQSGYYNLKASMSLEEICKLLKEGGTAEPEEPVMGKILIPEGYTLQQIAEAVTKNKLADDAKTPFSADAFLATVQDEGFISKMVAKYPQLLATLPSADTATYRLEGYLFPATYSYYEDTTIEDLVDQMLSTMNTYLSSYYKVIASKGLTVNDVLTLASLIEKEGATDDDRRNIASVFYNRLNLGMPLQSNIAILYAMGKLGEETSLESDAAIDTGIESPYNVYLHTGLMPGPVDSPSLSAIEAAVFPATTPYYYFVADVKTGIVYYSETYDDHEKNVETYVNSQLNH